MNSLFRRFKPAGASAGYGMRGRLLFFYALTTLLLLLVVFVVRFWLEDSVLDVNESYYSSLLAQTAETIDYHLGHYQQMGGVISRDPMLRFHMRQIVSGDRTRSVSAVWGITKQVMRFTNKTLFDNIYVYMPDQSPLNCYYEAIVTEVSPQMAALMEDFASGKRSASPTCVVTGTQPYRISLIHPVFDKNQFIGLIRLDPDMEFFTKIISEVEQDPDSTLLILDENNMVLFSTGNDEINTPLKNTARLEGAVRRELSSVGWHFAGTLPRQKIQQVMSRFVTTFIIMAMLIMVTVTAYSLFTFHSMLTPMRPIIDSMKAVEAGNLDTELPRSKVREYNTIIEAFNSMVRKVRELLETVYYQQVYLRKAQIGEMQSKFNPHFLYNTLDMIYWQLVEREDDDTAEMVVALSEILRYSIASGQGFTPLRDERHQIENYLLLQSKRMGKDFEWEISFDEEIMDYKTPCLLLQPLVENAVNHAFKGNNRNYRYIGVTGHRQGENLILTVVDNGVGMSREAIEKVLSDEAPPDGEDVKLGINLVHRRLQYIYGAIYGIQIQSSPGNGCAIRVILPAPSGNGQD